MHAFKDTDESHPYCSECGQDEDSHPRLMRRGDYVQTLFDTGAMGLRTLLGKVVKAGNATYTVEWESGIRPA